jgi:bifunctional oligoribonuclease and PAP phosphatase NrnA
MDFWKKLKMIWSELSSIIKNNSSFLISSHMSLDGDSIGSELAFLWYLRSLSKNVEVYNHESVPPKFQFLQDSDLLKNEKPAKRFDVLLVLDCSNPKRLGWDDATSMASTIVNIDHHRDNVNFGHSNFIRGDASATGQIIYDYFFSLKLDFPASVAEALYTAILTDTGGFRFSNTNSTVLKICADLCERGASSSKIYNLVYTSLSPNGLMLQAKIWSTLTFYHSGTVCSMEMPYHLIDEVGATYGDSEGMADLTIIAAGVQVGMLIKYGPTQTHFSLRSTGKIDVGKIAKSIEEGGGHSSAAGCTMSIPFSEAKPKMLEILFHALDKLKSVPQGR